MTHNKVFEQRNDLNNSSCDILASIASEIKAYTENFIKQKMFFYVFDTTKCHNIFFRLKCRLCKSKNLFAYFGYYIKNVVTNGELFVFLSLFYGQFVIVFRLLISYLVPERIVDELPGHGQQGVLQALTQILKVNR